MRHFSSSLLILCAAVCAAPAITQAQAGGGDTATSDPNAISLQGRIVSFNLNDRGTAEGMIVQSQGQLGQVNFPNEFADAKALSIGDLIEITILPDMGGPGPGPGRGPQPADGRGPPPPPQPDHAVYRLVALRDARGNQYNVPVPPQRSFAHVQGVVQTINYDRRGIANGAHLASGDFVSLSGPDAQQIQLVAGMNLTADGPAQAMPNGHLALHAQQINGIALGPGAGRGRGPDGQPPPDGGPPPPPPDANGPGGDAPPPPPDGGPQG